MFCYCEVYSKNVKCLNLQNVSYESEALKAQKWQKSQQNSGCGPGLLSTPEMHNNSSISDYNVSFGTVILSKETF